MTNDAPILSDQLGHSVNISAVGHLEARTVKVINDLLRQGYLTPEQAERASELKNKLFDQLYRPLPERTAPQPPAATSEAAKPVRTTRGRLSPLMLDLLTELSIDNTIIEFSGAIHRYKNGDTGTYIRTARSHTFSALIDRKLITIDRPGNCWRINEAGRAALAGAK